MICIYIYIYIRVKTKKEVGVSAKTALSKLLTKEGIRRRRGSKGKWEALMGLYWRF